LARPRSCSVAFSSLKPTSSLITLPPVSTRRRAASPCGDRRSPAP
jgi:hypothetical protein